MILSPGIDDIIPAKFFRSVIDHKKQKFLYKTEFAYICVAEETKVSIIDAAKKEVIKEFDIDISKVDKAVNVIHDNLDAIFTSEFVFLSLNDSLFENLKKQALQQKIKVPNYLKRWIPLSKIYKKKAE